LKKFLTEQLDYFIKSEVLNFESLSSETYLLHTTRAKLVKEIGEDIIDFLSQIEDFQKKLWEKKKFVIKTEYVITTDRVPEEFYDEIWKNEKQRKEWEELGFEIPKTKNDLKEKKLPIDTKYFDEEFKFRLIEKLTENADLDDLLDGLLIKSENWQALNTILNKYKEKVQTIYIDPPFNLGTNADFLYNVNYKDSTWASMLENRLTLAREMLNEKGSIFVRCDYNGNWIVRPIMNEIFGEENFRNEITIAKSKEFFKTMTHIAKFSEETESLFFFSKTDKLKFNLIYKEKEAPSKYEPFLPVSDKTYRDSRIINGEKYYSPLGRKWGVKQENIDEFLREGRLKLENGKWYLYTFEEPLKDVWIDHQGYSRNWDFATENSEVFVKRAVQSTSNEGDLVMDFFLGSGTTTAVAHKLKRKWIGIEMGEHFWTVVLPRMKKVLAYDKSGISKENDVKDKYNEKTAGGFFKYQILEQYEDTLDNIELNENKGAENLFKDEYLLKYFLNIETRESPYLLNINLLKDLFSYKLKVNLSEVGEAKEMIVDIPETFVYLLGMKVKSIKMRNNNGNEYLFIFGQVNGEKQAIVFRKFSPAWENEEFEEDRKFIQNEIESFAPKVVYINGQSKLTDSGGWEIRNIESTFKRLMEA
jgi:adenine-specific DNA-methyltransferase